MATHKKFGGPWTEKKLEILNKYLKAYTTIMNKQPFKFAYIDAFAGTGYRQSQTNDNKTLPLEISGNEKKDFIKGSARIALDVQPEFDKYVFIEKEGKSLKELENLIDEFPEKKNKIETKQADANSHIKKLCKKSWKEHRAVMFLDPFGMEVEWATIEAIAKTKAIDLWVLFPLGAGVNRLLKKDGLLESWAEKMLNRIFGTEDWKDKFYQKSTQSDFFNSSQTEKIVNLEDIGNYYIKQLKSIFTKVADNPAKLYNSKRNPLFLFCFCAGNPKGAKTAVKIAQHILTKI